MLFLCDPDHIPASSCLQSSTKEPLNNFLLAESEIKLPCKLCQSHNQNTFPTEMNIHFPGPNNLTKPSVWAFPKIVVCLDCGFTEFRIQETELCLLKEGMAEKAGIRDQRE